MNDLPITGSDMLCFICQDFFCRPCTAVCGHSFCEYCIQEYFLYAEICPICSKSIRSKGINSCPSLGEFVQRCLRNDREEMLGLEARKQQVRKYEQGKQIRGLRVGLRVDIRDSNYIWCEGMITRIFLNFQKGERVVRVAYLNYMEEKEEEVELGSHRLATKGFYTSRKDIPFYQDKRANLMIKKLSY